MATIGGGQKLDLENDLWCHAESSGCYAVASSVTRSRSTWQRELVNVFFFSFAKEHLLTNTKNDDDKNLHFTTHFPSHWLFRRTFVSYLLRQMMLSEVR